MKQLGRWIREQAERVPGACRSPSPVLRDMRLIVLDVDVTGIDIRNDRASGIAYLPIDSGEVRVAEIGYCRLPEAHETDDDVAADYHALVTLVADHPVLTYNARFVKHMIKKSAQQRALPLPYGHWIDIASALYGVFGGETNELESVRRWQERMKLQSSQRHCAVEDVFLIAQMAQAMIAYCEELGVETLDDLRRAQNARVWLRG